MQGREQPTLLPTCLQAVLCTAIFIAMCSTRPQPPHDVVDSGLRQIISKDSQHITNIVDLSIRDAEALPVFIKAFNKYIQSQVIPNEPGTLQYEIFQATAETSKLLLVERYAHMEAMQAHAKSPAFFAFWGAMAHQNITLGSTIHGYYAKTHAGLAPSF